MVSENELVERQRAMSARAAAQSGPLKRMNKLSMRMLGFDIMGNLDASRTSYSSTPVQRPDRAQGSSARPSTSGARPSDDVPDIMPAALVERQGDMLRFRGLHEARDGAENNEEVLRPGSDSSSNFLYYLWAKNPKTNASCPHVRCPHTVLVEGGKVRDHFFTSKKMEILRKGTVNNANKYKSLAVIVAANAEMIKRRTFLPSCVFRSSGQQYLDAQHMKEDALKEQFQLFVLPDGVYQSFVVPVGERNELLLATWVDGALAVEKRTCTYKLASKQAVEKFVMGDSERNWQSSIIPMTMKNIWFRKISTTCNSIAQHIHDVSPQKYSVQEMKLIFKQDDYGSLWLCWCTHILVKRTAGEVKTEPAKAKFGDSVRFLLAHTKSTEALKENARASTAPRGPSRRGEFMPFRREALGTRRLMSATSRETFSPNMTMPCPPRDFGQMKGGPRATLWFGNPLSQTMAASYRRAKSPL